MASFIASNFIRSYAPTSKTLKIQNSMGSLVTTISVCNYQKSLVDGKNLNVVLEDSEESKVFDFSSNAEAKQALFAFKQAIDTLKPNCTERPQGGGATVAPDPISLTYVQYKDAAANYQLIKLQWYDVVDTTGVILDAGTQMRLLATSENDSHPRGSVLNETKAYIAINTITDEATYYVIPQLQISAHHTSPKYIDIQGDVSNVNIRNGRVGLTNANNIIVDNSRLIASDSSYVKAFNNSDISGLSGASSVAFNGITQDFTNIELSLNHVTIDTTSSIGKLGRNVNMQTENVVLQSYQDAIEQEFIIDENGFLTTVVLENLILEANAEFRLKLSGGAKNSRLRVIAAQNMSVLYEIGENGKGQWATFRFNKNTKRFEFVKTFSETAAGIPYRVPSIDENNPSEFSLPIPSSDPTKLQMYVNGLKMHYGFDFTYSGDSQKVTFTSRLYDLNIYDEVEFIIF